MSKYFNPYTDFGFKKLFGEEANKDILMDFLNEVLRDEQPQITNIEYLKTEQLGLRPHDRKAIFDLYCTNKKGEHFIVEMQKARQEFFKDRALYYSTFPIQQQAEKGENWNYKLEPVYMIAIVNFEINDGESTPDKYMTKAKISDVETHHIFYDKLTFIFLEMPKFNKELDKIETKFEKWLYLLKYLPKFERMPDKLKETVFQKVFQIAELSNLSNKQLNQYNDSLKQLWDMQNVLDTSFHDGERAGLEKGKIEGKIEIARRMKAINIPLEQIVALTDLLPEEIENL